MHRQAPQFKLKPLPVAILEKPLPKNAFFTKVDLAEAYYHFTLSPPQSTSHHLLTGWRVQLLHKTTRLPFGLCPSPFIMQQLATALTRHLRALGVWAWSHLDIFLLAHTDLAFLATVTRQFTTHLTNCGININPKDTQSEPTQTIKFLGLLLKRSRPDDRLHRPQKTRPSNFVATPQATTAPQDSETFRWPSRFLLF